MSKMTKTQARNAVKAIRMKLGRLALYDHITPKQLTDGLNLIERLKKQVGLK